VRVSGKRRREREIHFPDPKDRSKGLSQAYGGPLIALIITYIIYMLRKRPLRSLRERMRTRFIREGDLL